MRLDRLLEIVIILLNRRQITARELADRFEVSVRTIYRDIEAINLAGVPVVSTQGQGGGFTVLETFRIDRQVLTLDDMASIAAALRGVHGVLADPDSRRALEKITALVPGERSGEFAARSEMLVIRPNPYGLPDSLRDAVQRLHQAIIANRPVEFAYRDVKGVETLRRVEPHTLILYGPVWYLYGWCRLREDWRLFRLSRIRAVTEKGTPFTRRVVDWERALAAQGETPLEEVRLRFNPAVRTRIEDIFGYDAVHEGPDGTLNALFRWPVDDWVTGFLLGFGPDAEVLAPPALRERIRERAAAAAARYTP